MMSRRDIDQREVDWTRDPGRCRSGWNPNPTAATSPPSVASFLNRVDSISTSGRLVDLDVRCTRCGREAPIHRQLELGPHVNPMVPGRDAVIYERGADDLREPSTPCTAPGRAAGAAGGENRLPGVPSARIGPRALVPTRMARIARRSSSTCDAVVAGSSLRVFLLSAQSRTGSLPSSASGRSAGVNMLNGTDGADHRTTSGRRGPRSRGPTSDTGMLGHADDVRIGRDLAPAVDPADTSPTSGQVCRRSTPPTPTAAGVTIAPQQFTGVRSTLIIINCAFPSSSSDRRHRHPPGRVCSRSAGQERGFAFLRPRPHSSRRLTLPEPPQHLQPADNDLPVSSGQQILNAIKPAPVRGRSFRSPGLLGRAQVSD